MSIGRIGAHIPLGIVVNMQTGTSGRVLVKVMVRTLLAELEAGSVVLMTDPVAGLADHLRACRAVGVLVGAVHRDNLEVPVDDHERLLVGVDQ